MSTHFRKFVQLTKVDEAKREVGGIVTSEVVDKEGEVCDYATTKPYYEEWSRELSEASDGKNLGNLRVMHTSVAAGVGKAIDYIDEDKEIFMTFKIVDDNAWLGVQEGMYTGFSQGGDYIKRWKKGEILYYTAKPSEISLVDNPCNQEAHFEFVRASGAVELRKFKSSGGDAMKPDPGTPGAAAAVAEPPVTKNSYTNLEKQAIRAGLQKRVVQIIEKQAEKQGLKKGMYEVSRLAEVLCTIAYLRICAEEERIWEGDDSTLPEDLQQDLESIVETFLSMAEEEATELLETANSAAKSAGGNMLTMNEADLKKAAHAVATHLKKMSKTVSDHHEKMHKLHKDHQDEMHEHIQKLHKILGTEEAEADGGKEPTAAGAIPAGATETGMTHKGAGAEGVTKADLEAAMEKATKAGFEAGKQAADEAFQAILKALVTQDDNGGDSAAAGTVVQKAAPAAGVGERPVILASAGPVVKVVPVTKADDATGVQTPAAPEAVTPAIAAAALQGDREAALKLMKGATPHSDIPATVASALGKVKGA